MDLITCGIVVSLFVALFCVAYQVKFGKRNAHFAKFPAPKRTFLLHNAPQLYGLNSEQLFEKLKEWHNELGDVFLFSINAFDCGTVVISDPEIAEAVSFHQPDRNRSITYRAIGRWIGSDGFFLAAGKKLKHRMKPVMHVINPKFFGNYINVMNVQFKEMIRTLEKINHPVDVFSLSRNTALDIVFELVMGFNLNAKNGFNSHYAKAIEEFSEIAMTTILDPISRISFLHPFTSLCRKEKKVLKVLHDQTRSIVQNRSDEIRKGKTREILILDHYLENRIGGEFLTIEEIREEMDTMVLGAHDTTKSTLAFALYNMAKYPEAQEKVFEEVNYVLEGDSERDVTDEDVSRMPWTEACTKESLRLFPPAPFVGRKLDSHITTGGYTFPKDTEVFISSFLMGRSPKYFDDPLNFLPDRFIGVDVPPLAYTPFSIGARKCVGGKIAMKAMKIGIAKIIMNFKISLPANHEEVAVYADLVLRPKGGIMLKFDKRE